MIKVIEARPATSDRLSISFELDFGAHTAVGRQSYAVTVDPDSFRRELAPCRTFLLEKDAHAMAAQGIGQRVDQTCARVGEAGDQVVSAARCANNLGH